MIKVRGILTLVLGGLVLASLAGCAGGGGEEPYTGETGKFDESKGRPGGAAGKAGGAGVPMAEP